MTEGNLREAILIYDKVCREINNENYLEGVYENVKFEVLQLSGFYDNPKFAQRIAEFYDSYHKNKDFIHIPDVETVLENSMKYPIIIARCKEDNRLLGISTVKYFENITNVNPYFPIENRKYFEISGIMAREDNINYGIPGIGKHIFEILVLGACIYNKIHTNTGLMMVIDSRNSLCVNAVKSGLNMIRNKNRFGEGYELSGNIVGYYEVRDFETERLTEAQTIVVEFGLTPTRIVEIPEVVLEFRTTNSDVTRVIEEELRRAYGQVGIKLKSIIPDPGCGNVIYYNINKALESRIENVTIIPHESALGNDRISTFGENTLVKRKV